MLLSFATDTQEMYCESQAKYFVLPKIILDLSTIFEQKKKPPVLPAQRAFYKNTERTCFFIKSPNSYNTVTKQAIQ